MSSFVEMIGVLDFIDLLKEVCLFAFEYFENILSHLYLIIPLHISILLIYLYYIITNKLYLKKNSEEKIVFLKV